MRALTLSLAILLTGCPVVAGPDLADDFEDDLTETGGCGDVIFYAHDAADEIMLSVYVDGLIEEAQALGEETTTTFTLYDPSVEVVVEQGHRISDAMCDDLIENGGPQVERVWIGDAGTVTITVRPGAEGLEGARADLLLEEIVVEDKGDTFTIEAFEILDVSVGWLAG